jgi:uncharacterized HhH-GPD family protein
MAPSRPRLRLAQQPQADALLGSDPFALLVGMLLDQQFPMERAFAGPRLLADRLGVERLDPAAVAAVEPARMTALMTGPPAVHRYPGSMGERIQALAAVVVAEYDGRTESLWLTAGSGPELYRRLTALPGFGAQKSKIFTALLAKQLGVVPEGWQEVAGDYALTGFRSVADVVDETSLQRVRDYKKAAKAAARESGSGGR